MSCPPARSLECIRKCVFATLEQALLPWRWMSSMHCLSRCPPQCTSLHHGLRWMTKLVVADELSAHIEPRRAMAVLMNIGKPLQATDSILMTAWVVIFCESGLRDDVTIANLQEACLKLVVPAWPWVRAYELQVDIKSSELTSLSIPRLSRLPPSSSTPMNPSVSVFFKPDGCKN